MDESAPDNPRDSAIRRVEAAFRDIYLTLISIIQGVALGFLVQAVGQDYHHIDVDKAGRIATTFLAVVVIWQEYVIGSTMYAWIPRTIDALVPFLLGAGQGLMIAALDGTITEFLTFFTFTAAIGLIAAINYARHARSAELETTRQAQRIISIHPRSLVWIDSGGLALGGTLLAYSLSPLPQPQPAALSLILVCSLLTQLVGHHWRWSLPMQRGR